MNPNFLTKDQYLKFKMGHPLSGMNANQSRDVNYQKFLDLGLPSKSEEYWRYTTLKELEQGSWNFEISEPSLSHEDLKAISALLHNEKTNLVFVDGFFNKTLSDSDFAGFTLKEVTAEGDFHSEAEAANQEFSHAKLSYLSNAFLNHKHSLELANDQIHILYYQTGQSSYLCQPQWIVNVKSGSTATVVISHVSAAVVKKSSALNGFWNFNLANNSYLNLVQFQDEDMQNIHLSKMKFKLGQSSHLKAFDLASGGSLSRHVLEIDFQAENSSAVMNSLSLLEKKQHTDFLTFIKHSKGKNESFQNHKTVLSDDSQSIFRGRVRIEPKAQKANSEQLCKNLLLTPKANAISIPQLEIYADDVKATHGATVGELNKEELFYFLSRGINAVEATKMMALGFALDQASLFESTELKELISNQISQKLKRMLEA